jgi:hypothetical protein
MALLKVGSINNFSVTAKASIKEEKRFLRGLTTFSDLSEVSRTVALNSFEFIASSDQRGLAIKSLKLTEGFEGYLSNLFKDGLNNVYFVAWAWDLSGEPIYQYPGTGVEAKDVLIPIKVGKLREFIGAGISLFPKRVVKGGMAVRIQIWESDQQIRTFGKAMSDTADAIQKSELNALLSLISTATGVSGATVALIKEASIELAKVIGTVLQANGEDYVDFFEGYYPADKNWVAGNESYEGNSSVLTLDKY